MLGSGEHRFVRSTRSGIRERYLFFFSVVERLAGEVVEAEGEEGEHDDADHVVVQWIMVAEARDGAIGGGFVEFDADTEESDDAAGGD